jgi:hypothetical protein
MLAMTSRRMPGRLWIAALAVIGCGGAPGAEREAPAEACDEVVRAPRFICPEGTRRHGKPPPQGNEMWCQRWDGTRHGSYRRFPAGSGAGAVEPDFVGDGAVVGEYREGEQHGAWWSRRAGAEAITIATYERGVLKRRATCRP